MPDRPARYVYWDSCVFLAYINGEPERAPAIEAAWDEIAAHLQDQIVTATVSIAEVAYASYEKT